MPRNNFSKIVRLGPIIYYRSDTADLDLLNSWQPSMLPVANLFIICLSRNHSHSFARSAPLRDRSQWRECTSTRIGRGGAKKQLIRGKEEGSDDDSPHSAPMQLIETTALLEESGATLRAFVHGFLPHLEIVHFVLVSFPYFWINFHEKNEKITRKNGWMS